MKTGKNTAEHVRNGKQIWINVALIQVEATILEQVYDQIWSHVRRQIPVEIVEEQVKIPTRKTKKIRGPSVKHRIWVNHYNPVVLIEHSIKDSLRMFVWRNLRTQIANQVHTGIKTPIAQVIDKEM